MIKITNDITTLNGSLMELGETLATNITAKGVQASASDGLTTLASKVLQISGGGSSITLSSNKNILSYYHSDTATLTATYESGATMELYNADTMVKIGNFTGSGGTYTYTYNSTGVGDINLVAKVGSDISNQILIEDCYLYAPTEISRTSTYNTDSYATMFNNFNFTSDNFECSVDIKWASNSTGFGVAQTGGSIYHEIDFANSLQSGQNKLSLYCNGSTYRYDTISLDTYYTIKFTFENDGTLTVYLNDTQKGEYDKSSLLGDTREIYWYEWSSGKTTYIKNVKIKEIGSNTPYTPCTEYQEQIANAITYINGSGS